MNLSQKILRAVILLAAIWGLVMSAGAATHVVEIMDYYFRPTNLVIAVGDTVVWTNRTIRAHDTTQGSASTPDAQRLWKSPNLAAAIGTFRTNFTTPGVFPYICLQHISFFPQQTGTVSVVGNFPPTVAVTAPANGSRHPSPPNFDIKAQAADPDGQVTNVFFLATASAIGTTNLGSVQVPPYTLRITNLPPASYQLRAVATDNEGTSSTSAVVSVLIAVPAPLRLLSPTNSAPDQFQFDISTSLGMTYIVEEARGVAEAWSPVSTNTGNNGNIRITRPFLRQSPTQTFYRAFIQP